MAQFVKAYEDQSKLDGCGKFIKYSIFVVNLITFLFGVLVLALGIWALVEQSRSTDLVQTKYGDAPAIILLVFGGVVAFISFLGCCGALKEVKCLLLTFFIVILVITILLIVGVSLMYTNKDKIFDDMDEELKNSMQRYSSDESVRKSWDSLQTNLKCCGVDGFADWADDHDYRSVPDSCNCKVDSGSCRTSYPAQQSHWEQGCSHAIKEWIKTWSFPVLGVAIALIIILVMSLVFTCSLVLML